MSENDVGPAERDSKITIAAGLGAGLVGTVVGGLLFGRVAGPVLGLVCMLVTLGVVMVFFVDRFANHLLTTTARLRLSHGTPEITTDAREPELYSHGFAPGHWLTYVDSDDAVIAGPYLMLAHATEPMAAWTSTVSTSIVSSLGGTRVLHTTNTTTHLHGDLVTQVFTKAPVTQLIEQHQRAMHLLSSRDGETIGGHQDPQRLFQQVEDHHNESLRRLSRNGRLREVLLGSTEFAPIE